MQLGRTHRAPMRFPIHFTAPDRSKTYIGETMDVSSNGFSVQVKTDDPLPTIILAGILPSEIAGDAILCKARVVWQGGLAGGTKRASYKITSIARQSQDRLDALIADSLDQMLSELKDLPLLHNADPVHLEMLLQLARLREITAEGSLYEASSLQGTGLFILLSGQVSNPNDAQGTLYGPGSVIGQWADPASSAVPGQATARCAVRALHLPHALTQELQQNTPALAMDLQRALGKPGEPLPEQGDGRRRRMRLNVIKDLQEIPTLPAIFNSVMDCIENPEATPRELSQIIRQDQALTAKILRTVNSALYGFARKINSVHEAVVLLGMGQTANLAITAMLLNTLVDTRNPKQRPEAFWEHSLGCAYFATVIGERLRAKPPSEQAWAVATSHRRAGRDGAAADQTPPALRTLNALGSTEEWDRDQSIPLERLFTFAILHDIGLAILYLKFPDHYAMVQDAIKEFGTLYRSELEMLDVDHCQLGYRIAQAWRLPEPIPTIIAEHHLPQLWCAEEEDQARVLALLREDPVVTLISLADIMARRSMIGVVMDRTPPSISPLLLDALGLTAEEAQDILEQGPAIKDKSEALFRGMTA